MYVFLADAGCVPPVSVLEDVDEDGAPRETGWKRGEGRGVLKELLSDVDVFMLFLAAIGHDAGHPGLNNGFMVRLCPFSIVPYSIRHLSIPNSPTNIRIL